MNQDGKKLFSNLKLQNWKNLVLTAIACFYFFIFIASFGNGAFAGDYLGFWSVGKIADEKGYSKIYDLANLKNIQAQKLEEMGYLDKPGELLFSPTPTPFFSFFIPPFQLISKISFKFSYCLWVILNLIILIGYLVFFLQKILLESKAAINGVNLLILMLISYPVHINLYYGQVGVFHGNFYG